MNNAGALFNGIYNNRKVLVTGHTGFKGSWLSLWLKKLGAQVIGYALKPPTNPNLFEAARVSEDMISIMGDVCDFSSLKAVIEEHKPEMLFHMAAQSLVRYSYKNPVETYSTNIMGTVNVFEAVRQVGGVRAVVNVTSDKCYENMESARGYSENDRLGGHDPYSSSKGCAELVTRAYLRSYFDTITHHIHGVSVASVRAGNVIGGGDWSEDRLIPDCVRALINKKPILIRYPDSIRPWQHVLEPLYGYLLLGQRLYEDGPLFTGAWNFGPDDMNSKSVRWIVEKFIELWGRDSRWEVDGAEKHHEASCLKVDSSKARLKLDWHPHWDIEETMKHSVEWYKAYYGQKDISKVTLDQLEMYENALQNRLVNDEV